MNKRISLGNSCYIEVDVEAFRKNKNILNLDLPEGTIEKCRICEVEEVWVIIPERLVFDGNDN